MRFPKIRGATLWSLMMRIIVYGGFPRLGVPIWGSLMMRIIVYFGSIMGSPYSGTVPYATPEVV